MDNEVDEPIEVVAYNPAWPRMFGEEVSRLRAGVTEHINCIEHFGSTSVPGMAERARAWKVGR